MILTDILAESYRRLGFAASPAAVDTTRLTGFANAEVKEVLSDPILSKLRRRTLPFSTIQDVATCTLPQAVTAIHSIVDRTNQRELDERDQAWIREQDPGRSFSSGTPEAFAVIDYASAIARQPSDSSQLLIKSSSASDVQVAYIEIINADGYIQTANVTLTGVTALNIGPADSVSILDLYLASTAVGEVTLHEDTGSGTELAKIGIGKTRARYIMLEIFPTPSAVVTLHVDADVTITDLVNGTDESSIPDEFNEVIIYGVMQREFDKREKSDLANKHERSKGKWVSRLHFHMHRKASGDRETPHRSQLGPFYPQGS